MWGYVVQAHRELFDGNARRSHPAEIVFDPEGQTSADALLRAGRICKPSKPPRPSHASASCAKAQAFADLSLADAPSAASTGRQDRTACDTLLGWLYSTGRHVPHSLAEGGSHPRLAAHLGSDPASRLLADMLLAAPDAAHHLIGPDVLRQACTDVASAILHAPRPQEPDALCQAYLNHPLSVQENVRRLLRQAAAQGDASAPGHLARLIAQGQISAHPAAAHASLLTLTVLGALMLLTL